MLRVIELLGDDPGRSLTWADVIPKDREGNILPLSALEKGEEMSELEIEDSASYGRRKWKKNARRVGKVVKKIVRKIDAKRDAKKNVQKNLKKMVWGSHFGVPGRFWGSLGDPRGL